MMNEPWIYIVLLGAVIALFGWLKPQKEKTPESFQRNMEDTLEHYVDEIAAENDKLLQVVEKLKQEHDLLQEATRRRMDKMEAGIQILSEKLELMQSLQVTPLKQVAPATKEEQNAEAVIQEEIVEDNTVEEPIAVQSIRSRYPELFDLLDQGVEASAAAEQLQLPLGEVQLITQLALQEEKRV